MSNRRKFLVQTNHEKEIDATDKMKKNLGRLQVLSELSISVRRRVELWLSDAVDAKSREEVLFIIQNAPHRLKDLFSTDFTFGTAGFRALMDVGTSRLNNYSIAKAAEGVAYYFKERGSKGPVVIGYDSRHHSLEFAKVTARVLAGCGIRCYLFSQVRPSPFLSFFIRHKKCSAGIMITASHNPKEYNGFEIYGPDGGGITSAMEKAIVDAAQKVQSYQQIVYANEDDRLIEWVELEEYDLAYLSAVAKLQKSADDDMQYGPYLRIVYTSLHGAGITLAPRALKGWGFTSLSLVERQTTLDGDFPTIIHPNPGDPGSLKLGMEHMEATSSDILIANDCDSDRIGIAVMHKGKPRFFTGNEFATLCAYYVCSTLQEKQKVKGAFVISYVTTELIKDIAASFGLQCFEVPTGFKYISEKIEQWESGPLRYEFLFGAEESCGCLMGTYTRNKDGIAGACVIAEIALAAKRRGQTLVDMLYDIYRKYGVWREKLYSLHFEETELGFLQRKKIMDSLRAHPPSFIKGMKVISKEDFLDGIKEDLLTGKKEKQTLPPSDMLIFRLEDGSKAIIRPSGTEARLRVHVAAQVKESLEAEEMIAKGDLFVSRLLDAWVDELEGYIELQ